MLNPKFNKFYIAIAGALAQAVAQGLINGTAAAWVGVILAALTAAGVVTVANKTE